MIIMKKLISLLIGCSLVLAGAALAQQPDEQQQPSKGKRAPKKEQATQAQPGANAGKPQAQERPATQAGPTKERGAMKQRGATNEHAATNQPGQPGAEKGRKTHAGRESANTAETNVSGQPTGEATTQPGAGKGRKGRAHEQTANAPATGTDVSGREAGTQPTHRGKQQAEERKKGMKQPAEAAKTSGSPAAAGAATGTNAVQPPATSGQQNVQANAQARGTGAVKQKPAPQQVQQVKAQRANFRAQPKPQQVQAVTFNQNYRIQGSDNWQGTQYQVFRSYRPEWHDAGWYNSRYGNVALIAGGYYFFNQGYWYPAWGYNASSQYYAYDGPIYVGQRAQPPDQVIAQTQDLLQQMGYYTGEVDGLLGPLTREALAAYQADNGLTAPATIDQPTLDSLGLA
jgi:Putative peptidoglycan binding domain